MYSNYGFMNPGRILKEPVLILSSSESQPFLGKQKYV